MPGQQGQPVATRYVYTVADYSLIENSSLRLIATNGLGLGSAGVKLPVGSIAKTDSKASLRELDRAKRHGETKTEDDREPCKYDSQRIDGDRNRV